MLDSCLRRNNSERAGKVNLHDQSCSGFTYCFPNYRRFIRHHSPGGGFWRAEGFWLLLTSWALLGDNDEDKEWRTRAGGWGSCAVPEQEPGMGPLGKGARCAGQGWTRGWNRALPGRAGTDRAVNPWELLCCSDVGHGNVWVLSAAFCVMEEREPHSLTHCAKVYSARVVTSSGPPSPTPLFFSAHMSDYLVWETSDSPLYDSDVWHFLPLSVKRKLEKKV